MAIADSCRARRYGRMVGLGRNRTNDRLRQGLAAARDLELLPPGYRGYPAGRRGAYAAFALRSWLTSNPAVSDRTRRFARWSAIAAMALAMSGQVAYHLLTQAGVTRAPWEVTTLVSCLPVLVLGMGSALAHMLRSDCAADSNIGQFLPAGTGRPDRLEPLARVCGPGPIPNSR